MSLGILLIIVGIVVALLGPDVLGIVLVLIGLALLLLPRLGAGTRRA